MAQKWPDFQNSSCFLNLFYGGSIFIQKYLNLFISKIGKNQNNFAVAKEICNGNDIVFEQKSGQGNELRQKTYIIRFKKRSLTTLG